MFALLAMIALLLFIAAVFGFVIKGLLWLGIIGILLGLAFGIGASLTRSK